MSEEQSTELEKRLKHSGDLEALAEIFSINRARLLRIVRFRMDRRLASRFGPEDVLQEAYIEAAKRVKHFQEKFIGSAFLWMRMMVNQTLVDMHRRHLGAQKRSAGKELNALGMGYAVETSLSLSLSVLGSVSSHSKAVATMQLVQKVKDAIEEMDEMDREVLALRHFEELTNKEVAEALGIEQKAASIRHLRALKRLKDMLSLLPEFLDEGGGAHA